MRWRVGVEPWIRPFFHLYARLSRGQSVQSLGVVLNGEGAVLLVRSSELERWDVLREGVFAAQSPEAALTVALARDAGLQLLERPTLLAVQMAVEPEGGHQLVYCATHWRPIAALQTSSTLAQLWCPPHVLPENIRSDALAAIGTANREFR
jgi:hypothetical protein